MTNPVRHYDDTVRQGDCKILLDRGNDVITALISAHVLHKAMCVFLLDPTLRGVLEILDPKAVEQARAALLLT